MSKALVRTLARAGITYVKTTRTLSHAAEIAAYRADNLLFINECVKTFDPRPEAAPHHLDFQLWDYEQAYILWLQEHLKAGQDCLTEKSRDMGVSWSIMAWLISHWLFDDAFQALIGSRKEDLVDNWQLDSHFGRLEYIVSRLPSWLMPQGYTRQYMKLVNNANGNAIIGESANPNFSRQGRYSCLVAETLVLTEHGWMDIKSAMDNGEEWFLDREGNRKRVRAYLKRLPEPTVRVQMQYGYEVTGSADHPLLTEQGFKEMGQLKVGERLRVAPVSYFPSRDVINETQARVLGYLVSEGAIFSQSHVQFCQKAEDIIDLFIEDFEQAFGTKLFKRRMDRVFLDGKSNHWFVAERSVSSVRAEMEALGLKRAKSADKEVPWSVLQSSRTVQREFLRALFEGDGSVSIAPSLNYLRVSYTSKSQTLVRQIQAMLLSFGILSSVKTDKTRLIYTVQMNAKRAKRFCSDIGFISERKNNVHVGREPSSNHNQWTNLEEGFMPILQVSEGPTEPTYDVEIDGHEFLANGVVSHNCILLDEFSFWPWARSVWTASADASPCRVAVTTAEVGSFAKELRFGGQIDVKTLHWRLHPHKDDAWYRRECERRTASDIAKELDINWEGAVRGLVYGDEWKAIAKGNFPYVSGWPLFTSWDFGLDGTALIWWQRNPQTGLFRIVDCYGNSNKTIDFYVPWCSGQIKSGLPYGYSEREIAQIESHRGWPGATHYGDVDVAKRNLETGRSTREILRGHNIHVQTRPDKNDFGTRWQETKLFLRRVEGVNLPACALLDDAMSNARFPERPENSQGTSEKVLPIHDWTSHLRTSCEYQAVNAPSFVAKREPKPIRRHELRTLRRW